MKSENWPSALCPVSPGRYVLLSTSKWPTNKMSTFKLSTDKMSTFKLSTFKLSTFKLSISTCTYILT
jgi:hypothetical protein